MVKCYSQDAYDKYTESVTAATIKASGGVYGGGSEALVLQYQSVIGSLCARDYKGIGNQYAMEDKLVVETSNNSVQGFPLGFRAENTKCYEETATTICNGTRPGWCNGVCMATQQGGAEIRTDGKAPTLTAAAGMSGNNQPVYCAFHGQAAAGAGISADENIAPTLQGAKQADVAVDKKTLTIRCLSEGSPLLSASVCRAFRTVGRF